MSFFGGLQVLFCKAFVIEARHLLANLFFPYIILVPSGDLEDKFFFHEKVPPPCILLLIYLFIYNLFIYKFIFNFLFNIF